MKHLKLLKTLQGEEQIAICVDKKTKVCHYPTIADETCELVNKIIGGRQVYIGECKKDCNI